MMEEYIKRLFAQEKRRDKRKLNEFRKIEFETGMISKAEGSALVKLGNTQVIAGVKLSVGEPFPDTPNEGILIVNAEFSPIAHPSFEPGPPGEDAIELARVVDRIIREGKVIDMKKLVIEKGKKVWMVFIDLEIVNNDGNLIDAAVIASMLALKNSKILKLEDENIVRGEYISELPLNHTALSATVGKFENKFIVDPDYLEEQVLDGKIVFGIREDGKICAIQKQGGCELDESEIEKMIDISIEKTKELRRLLGWE